MSEEFDEDTARDAWLEMIEAEGLTVEQYIALCPVVKKVGEE